MARGTVWEGMHTQQQRLPEGERIQREISDGLPEDGTRIPLTHAGRPVWDSVGWSPGRATYGHWEWKEHPVIKLRPRMDT